MFKKIIVGTFLQFVVLLSFSQTGNLNGKVINANNKSLANATILLNNNGAFADSAGNFYFKNIAAGKYQVTILLVGYTTITKHIAIKDNDTIQLLITLVADINDLNEVVVTGVSKATLIRENPVAITNVSAKNIDKTIETNIIDALVKNVPGLNSVKTGPNISKPFIRGLGYNRVLTLYDGMRQEGQQWGDEHGIEVDAYNIVKAEVIKGPASLMFGSDALAGVVSLFPYLPKEKDGLIHGKFVSEYQSNNGLVGNGIRIGYSNIHWLWAIKGSYRIAKNYTNSIDERVYNTGFEEKNLAALVGYTSAKGYSHFNATLYDNLQGIPDGSRDSLTRKFTKQVYDGVLDDITKRPIVSNAELNSYTLSPLHQHIQHYRIYTNNHYQIGKGEIDATIGFQQNIRREYSHPTAPQQASLFVMLNTINYGVKYIAPTFANIEITVGLNGMLQNNKSKNATDFPIPDYRLIDIGSYIYGKWNLEKLTISGGFRYDNRSLKSIDFYVSKNSITGFEKQVFLPDTAGATLQFASLQKNFTGTSLSIGLAYQLTDKISLKANIAKGYRSPSINEIASNGLDPGAHIIYLGNRNFISELSFQQDLGIIANFKNITATVSIFNNSISNYIYLTQLADVNGNALEDAQGNKTFQYEQAAAKLYGAEATLNIHPTALKGFGFNNNLALVYGYNTKAGLENKRVEGEYLPLIPPAKWLSNIEQEIATRSKIITTISLKFEVEYSAPQNRYLALYNTETYTPPYSLINISAATKINYIKDKQMQLQLQVNNLLDVAYQNNLSRLKYFEYFNASPTGQLGMYNMGRNICVKMIIGF